MGLARDWLKEYEETGGKNAGRGTGLASQWLDAYKESHPEENKPKEGGPGQSPAPTVGEGLRPLPSPVTANAVSAPPVPKTQAHSAPAAKTKAKSAGTGLRTVGERAGTEPGPYRQPADSPVGEGLRPLPVSGAASKPAAAPAADYSTVTQVQAAFEKDKKRRAVKARPTASAARNTPESAWEPDKAQARTDGGIHAQIIRPKSLVQDDYAVLTALGDRYRVTGAMTGHGGKERREIPFERRIYNSVGAIVNGGAGAAVNAAGMLANWPVDLRRRLYQSSAQEMRGALEDDSVQLSEHYRQALQQGIDQMEGTAQSMETTGRLAGKIYEKADALMSAGEWDRKMAKRGLGEVGSLLVDAGISAGQSAIDSAIGLATGTGMTPFVLRAFGGSTQEARLGGADYQQQMQYGIAQAAKEYVTEKLFGLTGPQRLVGGGSLDSVIESGIRNVTERLAATPAGQKVLGGVLTWLASGATEGLEETIGAIAENTLINPYLRGWDPDTRTGQQKFEDALYETLVGNVAGLIGGVNNIASYQPGTAAKGGGGTSETDGGPADNGPSSPPLIEQMRVRAEEQAAGQEAQQAPDLMDLIQQVQQRRETERQAQEAPVIEQEAAQETPEPAARQDTAPMEEAPVRAAQRAGESRSFLIDGVELQRRLQEIERRERAQTEAEQAAHQPAQDQGPDVMSQEIARLFGGKKRVDPASLTGEQLAAVDAANEAGAVDMDASGKLYQVNPQEHIDQRQAYDMGDRKINAFQFDHPQLHPFYAEAAKILSEEMDAYIPGGETLTGFNERSGSQYFYRSKRQATERVADLIDNYGLKTADINKAIDAIINDKGQENIAAAKRLEIMLDDMLSNGFTDIHGEWLAPVEAYLDAKANIAGANTEDGLGAAEAGRVNTDYDRLQAQSSEFHPEGPNAARHTDVPKTDFGGRPISQTASTVYGAKAVPDDVIPMIEQMISSGKLSYDVITDSAALDRARANITQKGFQAAMEEYRSAVRDHKATKDITVLGEVLLNNAANAKDGGALAELLMLYQANRTNTAQAQQAGTIIRKLSPESQLYAIQKSVAEINKGIRARNKGKGVNADDADAVADTLRKAAEQAARDLEDMTAAYENVVNAMREGYEQAGAEKKESPGWVEKLGQDLAKNAKNRAGIGGKKQTARLYSTLLNDLTSFMNEHVSARKSGTKIRTAADKIADLFANRDEYARAWNSAQEQLRKTYKNNPAAMDVLEEFLQSTMAYNGVGPDTTMLRAVAEAALENDVTIKDTVIKGQYDRAAIVDQIADTLIQKTGAEGPDQTVIRGAVERWVQNQIDRSGKTAGDYISRDIRTTMREIGADMSQIIRSGKGDRALVEAMLSNMLTQKYGVSQEAAADVARDVTEQFREMVRESSQKELDRMFRQREKRAKKTVSQKLEELINLGAFSSGEYNHREAVRRVFGVEGDIAIPQELIQKFLDAESQEARDNVRQEILMAAAEQLPGSWREIFDKIRYLKMLFNPNTHIKNIGGNSIFQVPVTLKNRVGAAAEIGYNFFVKPENRIERTKTLTGEAPTSQLVREARADWKNIRDFVKNGKYDENRTAFGSDIKDFYSPFRNVEHFQKTADLLGATAGKLSDLNFEALSEAGI